jgi:hypothetical protein
MDPGPACQAYWNVDAVFEATVVKIMPLPRTELIGTREIQFDDKLVTLQVHRSWKGPPPGAVEVTTAPDEAACGFPFEQGERYLVFAHAGRSEGRLVVSSCNLTQRFDRAKESVDFLASLDGPAAGGRVFGSVRTSWRVFDHRPQQEWAAETTVRLIGGGRERTTTSAGGSYEFSGLADGSYRVEIEVLTGHTTYQPSRDVRLANRRSCARESFWFAPNGRIAGRLGTPDGRPVNGVRVEVAAADARPHRDYGIPMVSAATDADGFFHVGGLPPGRYIVGLNLKDLPSKYNPYARTVYPGGPDPHVIELGLGLAVDLGSWQIPPPLPIVRIEGTVTRRDGAPVAGVHVTAWDQTNDPIERARGAGRATSGTDGRFVLELRRGRVYEFTVRDNRPRLLRTGARRLQTGEESTRQLHVVVLDDDRQ